MKVVLKVMVSRAREKQGKVLQIVNHWKWEGGDPKTQSHQANSEEIQIGGQERDNETQYPNIFADLNTWNYP